MEHVSTKPRSGALLLSTVLAAGLAFAQATLAQEASSESAGPYAKYLMSVGGVGREQALNDARGIDRHRAGAPEQAVEQAPAGAAPSYASYLRHNGMTREAGPKSASVIDRPQGVVASAGDPRGDVAPGPYAKYLILNGMTREAALSAARNIDQGGRSARQKLAHFSDRADDGAER